jgi:hypothetical protein
MERNWGAFERNREAIDRNTAVVEPERGGWSHFGTYRPVSYPIPLRGGGRGQSPRDGQPRQTAGRVRRLDRLDRLDGRCPGEEPAPG